MYCVGALFFENGEFKQLHIKFDKIESAFDFVKNNIKSKDTCLHYYILKKEFKK